MGGGQLRPHGVDQILLLIERPARVGAGRKIGSVSIYIYMYICIYVFEPASVQLKKGLASRILFPR